MAKETRLPAIPHSADPSVKALKEALEVRLGRRGDPMDKAVTVRDLYDGGVINVPGRPTSGGGGGGIAPVPTPPLGNSAVPPAPTNLVANGAFVGILLSWDRPVRRDLTAHIYRSSEDDLATAIFVGLSVGNIYSDLVGHGKTYYYWIRYVSTLEVTGTYNAIAGTEGVTSVSVSEIMDDLSDSLGAGQLDDFFYIVEAPGLIVGADGTEYENKSEADWLAPPHNGLGAWFAPGTYIRSAMIADASIDIAKIGNLTVDMAQVTGTLDAARVTAITLDAQAITTGTLSAERIDVSVLNVADQFLSGTLNVNNDTGAISWGKTHGNDFTNIGMFFGKEGGQLKFNIGSQSSYMYFDGTTLQQVGVSSVAVAPAATTNYKTVGTFIRPLTAANANSVITIKLLGGGGGGGVGWSGTMANVDAGGDGGTTTVHIKRMNGTTRHTLSVSGGWGGHIGHFGSQDMSQYPWQPAGRDFNDYGGWGQSVNHGPNLIGTGGAGGNQNYFGYDASGNGAGGGGAGDAGGFNVTGIPGRAGNYLVNTSYRVVNSTDYLEIITGEAGAAGYGRRSGGTTKRGGKGTCGAVEIYIA